MHLRIVGLLLLIQRTAAWHNITVDDTSSDITYSGTWLQSGYRADRYGGTTHYTKTKGSSASFSFTGASRVYFVGYGIKDNTVDTSASLTLDGVTTTIDQFVTLYSAKAILWSSGDLDVQSTHTILIVKTSNDNGGRDLNVDGFVLTVPDGATIPASSSRVSTSSTSQSSIEGTIAESTSARSSDTSTTSKSTLVWSPTELAASFTGLGSQPVSSASAGATIGSAQSTERRMPTSTVVGAVLGSVAAVCILGAGCFFVGRYRRRRHEEFLVPNTEAFRGVEKTTNDLEEAPRASAGLSRPRKVPLQQAAVFSPVETAGSPGQERESTAPSSGDIQMRGDSPVVIGRRGMVEASSQLPPETPNPSSSISDDTWDQSPPAYSPRRSRVSVEDWKPGRARFDSTNQ